MEIEIIENLNFNENQNLIQVEIFRNQLEDLQQKILPILDDFKKYFILYFKHPTNSEYVNNYNNIITNMHTLNKDLYNLGSNVVENTNKLNEKLFELDIKINEEKNIQNILKKKLKNLENTNNGSDILIDEYVTIYNNLYFKNISIIFGIILLGFTVGKIFIKKE